MPKTLIRQPIIDLLSTNLAKLGFEEFIPTLKIEFPKDEQFGHYTSNIALLVGQKTQQPPRQVADLIKAQIEKSRPIDLIDRVEIAGPGFINFWLARDWFRQNLLKINQQKDQYGQSFRLRNAKIMIEYTDPNPFKEFHIGHLMSNSIGEAISRLFEKSGAEVKRANYQGDVGVHVAKAIWGIQSKIQEQGLGVEEIAEWELGKRVEWMGQAYALGATKYKEDPQIKQTIDEINLKIYERSDGALNHLFDLGRQWSLDYFETIYAKLETRFDFYFFESQVSESGRDLVKKHIEDGIFEKSNRAVIFPGEKYGLHNRVFLNSAGLPTYEAKELALAQIKYQQFPYDLSFVVTNNEIVEYFKVLLKVMKFVYPELAAKTHHLAHGVLRFKTGKMSSRTGTIIRTEDLIEQIVSKIKQKMDQNASASGTSRLESGQKLPVAEMIAIAALKYSILKQGIGRDIVFDFDRSLSLDGNSGPYLLYTYARCQSVLRQLKSRTSPWVNDQVQLDSVELNNQEMAIVTWLARFPAVVEDAGIQYAPSQICTYLFELAQKFNTFYHLHPILGSSNEKMRLAITAAVGQVLKNGLWILGIQTVEQM